MPCPTKALDGACRSSSDVQSRFADRLSFSSKFPLNTPSANSGISVSPLLDCVPQNPPPTNRAATVVCDRQGAAPLFASSPSGFPKRSDRREAPGTSPSAACSYPVAQSRRAGAADPVPGTCWRSHETDDTCARTCATPQTDMPLLSTWKQARRNVDSEDTEHPEQGGPEASAEVHLGVLANSRSRSRTSESGLFHDASPISPRAASSGEASSPSRLQRSRAQDGSSEPDGTGGQAKKGLSRKWDPGFEELTQGADGKTLKAARLSLDDTRSRRLEGEEVLTAPSSDRAKGTDSFGDAEQRTTTGGGWSLAALWSNCRPVAFASGRQTSPKKAEDEAADAAARYDVSLNVASAEPVEAVEEGVAGLTELDVSASQKASQEAADDPEALEVEVPAGANEVTVWRSGAEGGLEEGGVSRVLASEDEPGDNDLEVVGEEDRSPSEPESFVSCNTHISTRDGSMNSTAESRNSSSTGDDGPGTVPQHCTSGSDFPFAPSSATLSGEDLPFVPPAPLSVVLSAELALPPLPTGALLTDRTPVPASEAGEASEGVDSEERGSRSDSGNKQQSRGRAGEPGVEEESRENGEEGEKRFRRRSHRLRGLQRDTTLQSAPPTQADSGSSSPASRTSQWISRRRPKQEAGSTSRRKASASKAEKDEAEIDRSDDTLTNSSTRSEGEAVARTPRKTPRTLRRKGQGAATSSGASVGRGSRRRAREEPQGPDSDSAVRRGRRPHKGEEAKKRRVAPRGLKETLPDPADGAKAANEQNAGSESASESSEESVVTSSSASDDSEYEEEVKESKRAKGPSRRGRARAVAAAAWRSVTGQQPQDPVLRPLSARGLVACGRGATRALSMCGDSGSAALGGHVPGGPAVRIGSLAAVSSAAPVSDLTALLGGGNLPQPKSASLPAAPSQPLLQLPGRSLFPTLAGGRSALSGVLGGLLGSRGAVAGALSGAKSPGVGRLGGAARASLSCGAGASLAGSDDEGRSLGSDAGDENARKSDLCSRKGSMESREATVSTVTAQENDGEFGDPWAVDGSGEEKDTKEKKQEEPGVGAEVAYLPVLGEKTDSGVEGEGVGEGDDAIAEIVHISEIDESQRLISKRVVIRKNKECLIGRDVRTCDLVADSRGEFAKMVSRRHAVIEAVPVPELFLPHPKGSKEAEKQTGEKAPLEAKKSEVSHEAYRLCLRDVGSMNGVAVNDMRQMTAFLRHGDIVTLGGVGALRVGRQRDQPESPFRFLVRFLHPRPLPASDVDSAHWDEAAKAVSPSEAPTVAPKIDETEQEGRGEGGGLRLARLKVVHLLTEEEIRHRLERTGEPAGPISTHNSLLGLAPLDEGSGGSLPFPLSAGSHAGDRERVSRSSRLSAVSSLSPSLPRGARESPLRSTPRRWGRRGGTSGGGHLLLSASQEVYGSPTGSTPSPARVFSPSLSPARSAATQPGSPLLSASPLASPRRGGHPLSQPTAALSCLSQGPPPGISPLSLGPACFSQPMALEPFPASVSRASDRRASSVSRRGLSPLRATESRKMEIIGEVTVPWNGTIARVRKYVDALLLELLKDKLFSLPSTRPPFSASFSSADASGVASSHLNEARDAVEKTEEESGRTGEKQRREEREEGEGTEATVGAKEAGTGVGQEETRSYSEEVKDNGEEETTGAEPRLPAYELLPSPGAGDAAFKHEELSWVFELAPFNPSANLAVAPFYRLIDGEEGASAEERRAGAAPVRTVSTIYLRFKEAQQGEKEERERGEQEGGENGDGEREDRENGDGEREDREEKEKCSPACGLSFDDAGDFCDPAEEEEMSSEKPKVEETAREELRTHEGLFRQAREEAKEGNTQFLCQPEPRQSEGLLSEYDSDEAWHM
ncbi:FHA domain-containing protein [Toxoplasma gondii FOU]|uniref:FHA domain-containing protein n=1 Tax=Toxoplasma gondii FOU TaxID=943167 RepID=A0A086L7M6_TOXGO|nr:FHA domain-containing protein [Toxoplasma gondii FOU]